MNGRDIVKLTIKGYKETVKPYIESGDYEIAAAELNNFYVMMGAYLRDINSTVHCGLSFVSSAEMLMSALRKEEGIERTVRRFEMFSAQTGLPIDEQL